MHPDDLAHFEAANIVRPLALERFRADIYERAHLHCRQAVPEKVVERVFSVDAFDRLLTTRPLQRSWVDVIHANGRVERDTGANAALTVSALSSLIRAGASVRLLNLQHMVSEVAEVAGLLSRGFAEPVQTNLYFTPAHGSGLRPHFDDHDVWVLQCWGRKQWKIFDRYSHSVTLPRAGQRFNPELHRMQGDGSSVTMEPGDFLYVPRGFVHAVRCGGIGSMHLTFGMHGFTNEDLLIQCIRAAAADQIELRRKAAPSGVAVVEAAFSDLQTKLGVIFSNENLHSALTSLNGTGMDRMYGSALGVIAQAIRENDSNAGGRGHSLCVETKPP